MFLVTVDESGNVKTWADFPTLPIDSTHDATINDVYKASKDIVAEIEAQFLAERVGHVIARTLVPQPDASASSRIREALDKRKDEGE